jgi:hypothetical protein
VQEEGTFHFNLRFEVANFGAIELGVKVRLGFRVTIVDRELGILGFGVTLVCYFNNIECIVHPIMLSVACTRCACSC